MPGDMSLKDLKRFQQDECTKDVSSMLQMHHKLKELLGRPQKHPSTSLRLTSLPRTTTGPASGYQGNDLSAVRGGFTTSAVLHKNNYPKVPHTNNTRGRTVLRNLSYAAYKIRVKQAKLEEEHFEQMCSPRKSK